MELYYVLCSFSYILTAVHAVPPPAACFASFRWDDCGKPAVPVMYYWKPGSRCEVGMWRGCLPNINMFQDEYECVSTCIFTARAAPEDYHEILVGPDYDVNAIPETTVADYDSVDNETVSDGTQDSSTTEANDAGTETSGGSEADSSGSGGNAGETTASGTTLSAAAAVVTTTTAASSNK